MGAELRAEVRRQAIGGSRWLREHGGGNQLQSWNSGDHGANNNDTNSNSNSNSFNSNNGSVVVSMDRNSGNNIPFMYNDLVVQPTDLTLNIGAHFMGLQINTNP